jgi:ABC-type multidrug transport system permease subunit
MLQFFEPNFASPESMMEIMISPMLFSFFGMMMFIGAIRYEETYGKPATWWKWCYVPLALGLLFGIQRMVFLQDIMYAQTTYSRKIRIAHYMSFLVPVVVTVAITFWHRLASKKKEKGVYAGLS